MIRISLDPDSLQNAVRSLPGAGNVAISQTQDRLKVAWGLVSMGVVGAPPGPDGSSIDFHLKGATGNVLGLGARFLFQHQLRQKYLTIVGTSVLRFDLRRFLEAQAPALLRSFDVAVVDVQAPAGDDSALKVALQIGRKH